MYKFLENGNVFVLTKKGYEATPDNVKHERKIGEPIKGFETKVPESWIKNGYAEEGCIVSEREHL